MVRVNIGFVQLNDYVTVLRVSNYI